MAGGRREWRARQRDYRKGKYVRSLEECIRCGGEDSVGVGVTSMAQKRGLIVAKLDPYDERGKMRGECRAAKLSAVELSRI